MTTTETLLRQYVSEATRLRAASTTAEETYYPALRELWAGLLRGGALPFEVRTSTSERRERGGVDKPDIAFYDEGDVPVVYAEVKLPDIALEELAFSTERNDQIGRYLARTGVVILTNVRAFGLLTCKPLVMRDPALPVPPGARELRSVVEFWPSDSSLRRADTIPDAALADLAALLEEAVTEYAPIISPQALAKILARQARAAKAGLPKTPDSPALRPLYDDFRAALGLTFDTEEGVEFFRSSLVQTVFYTIFAGWTLWHRSREKRQFRWRDIQQHLKLPFIGALFHEIENPIRLRELDLHPHLDRAEETLRRVDVEAFFAKFSPADLSEDAGASAHVSAITYFYEPFLEAFDPGLREQLGVWFTPPEIVCYQVRKVEQLLKTELGCHRGFADERVVVLDPCCGTGAYLLEVARRIAAEARDRGDASLVGATLGEALSTRVIGFEILTAPFVIAQLQLYLLLADLGTDCEDHRPAVFLTNALTGWSDAGSLKLNFPELIVERELARGIKQNARIVVVLGNPPYNRFAGTALAEEADLVDVYKGIERKLIKGVERKAQRGSSALFRRFGVRKQLLDDLYIRFFRLADWRIGEEADYGVVSFISNSSYLTGRSHPLMRESLLSNFHEVWIDNTHGNRLASERTPAGESCETLFSYGGGAGIKVGTAISTFLKRPVLPTPPDQTRVHYRDFWGRATAKRRALLESLGMDTWAADQSREAAGRPEGPRPYESFSTTEARRFWMAPTSQTGAYEDWPALDELFPTAFQGVNPNRGIEGSVIDVDQAVLEARMAEYLGAEDFAAAAATCSELAAHRARYEPQQIWDAVHGTYDPAQVVPYLTFPLDSRFVYYETKAKLLNERRPEFWMNLGGNEFLVAVPQPRRQSESLPLLATSLVDLHVHDRGSMCIPALIINRSGRRVPNLAETALKALVSAESADGASDARDSGAVLIRTLMRVALAIMHAPQYQADHRAALTEDWARLPIPHDAQLRRRVADAGERLAVLLNPLADADDTVRHVLGDAAAGLATPTLVGEAMGDQISSADLGVTASYYGAAKGDWRERGNASGEGAGGALGACTGDLYLSARVYLANVPEPVWRYELGGYPVVKKWLGYRERKRRGGKPLSLKELQELRSIVQRIAAIVVLHSSLDALYVEAAADAFTAEELGIA